MPTPRYGQPMEGQLLEEWCHQAAQHPRNWYTAEEHHEAAVRFAARLAQTPKRDAPFKSVIIEGEPGTGKSRIANYATTLMADHPRRPGLHRHRDVLLRHRLFRRRDAGGVQPPGAGRGVLHGRGEPVRPHGVATTPSWESLGPRTTRWSGRTSAPSSTRRPTRTA